MQTIDSRAPIEERRLARAFIAITVELMSGDWLPGLFVVLYIGFIGFLISLLWRGVVALEKIARHLLEIARDLKDRTYSSRNDPD